MTTCSVDASPKHTLAGMDLLLHRIGLSGQVPARRAAERDEAAIAAWKGETWPVIKEPSRSRAPGWSSTHVSRAMRELIAARDWLTVFQLPAYASKLNPVESVWSHLKRSLANLAKRDIAQLTALAKTRLRHMQYQPGLVEGFLTGRRLDLAPLRPP
jgi:transposase